jgi:LDH2 family malate/lactate/ureidoglycolate dehydrogenase
MIRARLVGNRGSALTVIVLVLSGAIAGTASANEPCSGRKGGIANCLGDTFICNDGSVSGSKRACRAYMGMVGLIDAEGDMAPSAGETCTCRRLLLYGAEGRPILYRR